MASRLAALLVALCVLVLRTLLVNPTTRSEGFVSALAQQDRMTKTLAPAVPPVQVAEAQWQAQRSVRLPLRLNLRSLSGQQSHSTRFQSTHRGHGLEPQFHEKDPKREKKEQNLRRDRAKKSAKCWAPRPPGPNFIWVWAPPLLAPTVRASLPPNTRPLGPHFFLVWGPTFLIFFIFLIFPSSYMFLCVFLYFLKFIFHLFSDFSKIIFCFCSFLTFLPFFFLMEGGKPKP